MQDKQRTKEGKGFDTRTDCACINYSALTTRLCKLLTHESAAASIYSGLKRARLTRGCISTATAALTPSTKRSYQLYCRIWTGRGRGQVINSDPLYLALLWATVAVAETNKLTSAKSRSSNNPPPPLTTLLPYPRPQNRPPLMLFLLLRPSPQTKRTSPKPASECQRRR